jgi:hypothetical protein
MAGCLLRMLTTGRMPGFTLQYAVSAALLSIGKALRTSKTDSDAREPKLYVSRGDIHTAVLYEDR